MPDIRIKDLTTTASTTAADDFFAADGTTNGTRKLSAYSPTFGGNATVSGTLTVNGTNVSSIPRLSLNSPVETYNFASIGTIQSADVSLEVTSTAATGVGLGLVVRRTNGGEFARFINGAVTTRLANMSCDAAGTYFSISSAVGMYLDSTKTMFTGGNVLIGGTTDIPGTGGLKVFGTTASTTTSTGALVVGNGTSGGLGVGGAINAGSSISSWTGTFVARAASANPSFYAWTENTVADRGVLGFEAASSTLKYRAGGYSMSTGTEVFSITSAGNTTVGGALTVSGTTTADGLATSGFFGGSKRVIVGYNTSSDYGFIASVDTGVGWKELQLNPSGGMVKVPSSTASTSTSSGALVVSGGVGVAGNVCMGGDLSIQADKGIYQKQGNVHKWTSDGASTGTARADIYADSSGVLFFRTNGATEALSLNASQTAQFAGAVVANAASGAFRITNSQTPASAAATGTAGTIAWDSSYIYVCTATNTWKRVAISTW